MSRRLLRIFFLVLSGLAVLVIFASGLAWWKYRQTAADDGAWRTATVERGDIRVAISSTGTLSAISTVTVGSQISGQVTDVLVDYNDKVSKGQIVARIDPSTYQAQIEQGTAQINAARATLANAQATLRNAQLDYTRKAELGTKKLVAQSDVDLAKAALDQAHASVNSAQQQIAQQAASTQTTRLNLDRTVIRSPVDGVVLTRSIEPGQTVAANFSAPELFTIAEDLSKMKIELAVDESDIGQVKVGQTVSFTADAFPDRQFKGTVEQVRLSATTTNNVVTYPVIVTVDNSDGTLLPGLTVNAEIEVKRRSDVLKVSDSALRFHPKLQSSPPINGKGSSEDGLVDEIVHASISEMHLTEMQRDALDMGAKISRQYAQQRRPRLHGNGGAFGGVPLAQVVFLSDTVDLDGLIRQKTIERYKNDFSRFRALLNDNQREYWDRGLADFVSSKQVVVFRIVSGRLQPVMVRLGASDGSNTEVSGGGLKDGDLLVTGEKAAK